MPALSVSPRLVEQVYEALLAEIIEGALPPNTRLIQDDLAATYGVSRQPVQQALLLLRDHGLVQDAPRRGLIVSPLDVDFVRNLYDVRAVLEGLAARMAAKHDPRRAAAEGLPLIEAGRAAVKSGSVTQEIAADMAFHSFIYEASSNPLIRETVAQHWHYLRRVMAEVLRDNEKIPGSIWDEHAAILNAVIVGDGDKADSLGRMHIARAANIFVSRLQAHHDASMEDMQRRRVQRAKQS